jgi:hypothetical protein
MLPGAGFASPIVAVLRFPSTIPPLKKSVPDSATWIAHATLPMTSSVARLLTNNEPEPVAPDPATTSVPELTLTGPDRPLAVPLDVRHKPAMIRSRLTVAESS